MVKNLKLQNIEQHHGLPEQEQEQALEVHNKQDKKIETRHVKLLVFVVCFFKERYIHVSWWKCVINNIYNFFKTSLPLFLLLLNSSAYKDA